MENPVDSSFRKDKLNVVVANNHAEDAPAFFQVDTGSVGAGDVDWVLRMLDGRVNRPLPSAQS